MSATSRGQREPLRDGGARLLIVNADDFGLTPGVCRGILSAHREGVVSSTSALVNAPAFDAHAGRLRDSGLRVGAHLCAVGEDPPLLSAREIPSLVGRDGRFPIDWRRFLRRAAGGRIDTDDLRKEFKAQVEKLSHHRIVPSHLDTHQNLHLWPQLATVLLELAHEEDITSIRLPRTNRWNAVALGVRPLSTLLEARATRAGISYPDASLGLDELPGDHTGGSLEAVRRLCHSDSRSAELVVHLGEAQDPDRARYRSRFRWAEQLESICDPRVRAAISDAGFELGSFADLSTASSIDAATSAAADGTTGLRLNGASSGPVSSKAAPS